MSETRTTTFRRNERLEQLLAGLNSDLQPSEQAQISHHAQAGGMQYPVILVVGPLRSGTTLFMQWLANTNLVAYPTNLLSRFYQAPIIGAKIQLLLADHRYNFRDELVDAILGVYHGLFEALEAKMMSLLNRDQNAASKNRFGIESSMFERIIGVLRDNPLIEDAIIYGSRVKGVHKPGSDIDVVFKGKDLTLQDLNRITLALDDLLLPYTFDLSLFHHIDNEELLAHIGRVGKSIFRRQES